MSFRLFVYYCAALGACAAYIGWALGRFAPVEHHVARAGFQGLLLGLVLAWALCAIDALWAFSPGQVFAIGMRLMVGLLVGCLGGFFGAALGQILYSLSQMSFLVVVGWTVTGTLIGLAPGAFEFLASQWRNEDVHGPQRKVINGLLGGALGGLLGGLLFLVLQAVWSRVFGANADDYWSPSATGFVALGLCIGLLIGLAQVILKEAWLRVEKGFRPGRELILAKEVTTIGRAESCDVGLFGDSGVDKVHARIVRQGGGFLLEDAGTTGGTFLNGEPIHGRATLRSGDLIQVGRAVLRFGETHKQPGPA